jgi:hypothetical protein
LLADLAAWRWHRQRPAAVLENPFHVLQELRRGSHILGANAAFKIVLFERFSFPWGHLPQQVAFDRKVLNRLFVFHSPPQSIVSGGRESLHAAGKFLSNRGSPPAQGSAQAASSPVQKHPQVFAGDVKFLTNLIFIIIIQEDPLKQLAILVPKLTQRPPHQVRPFVLQQTRFSAGLPAGNFTGVGRKLTLAALPAEHLLHYVVRDGVHVRPQAFRVFDHSPAEISENPQKSLLPNVFSDMPGPEARDGLDADQIAEILGEMLRGGVIVFPEPLNILRVK